MNVAKDWATDKMEVVETESDTDLVQPRPSTPTPRMSHVDPPGQLSSDMRKHVLIKIGKSEHCKNKYPTRQCCVSAVHKRRDMRYICKFCLVSLHKEERLKRYHILKHFYEPWCFLKILVHKINYDILY
jgi:hypothetical protein